VPGEADDDEDAGWEINPTGSGARRLAGGAFGAIFGTTGSETERAAAEDVTASDLHGLTSTWSRKGKPATSADDLR
jgi:hypothetical protein